MIPSITPALAEAHRSDLQQQAHQSRLVRQAKIARTRLGISATRRLVTPRRVIATVATAIAVGGGSFAAASATTPYQEPASPDAAHIWWSGPDPDGGYGCLQRTGGDGGQCDAAMGLGPWAIPATDGGYRCLRDTLGASGQCNEAMGLHRPDVP
jgi:hypothetical protein